MIKTIAILAAVATGVAVTACKRHTFLSTKMKVEKISENCQNVKPSLRSEANIAGRRFEFERCLPAAFTEKEAHIERNSDTLLVNFPKSGGTAVFKITVDVDSYPEYHFLTIDNETFLIATQGD